MSRRSEAPRADRVEVGHEEAGELGQRGHGAVDEAEIADGELAVVEARRTLLQPALGPVEEGGRAGVLGWGLGGRGVRAGAA